MAAADLDQDGRAELIVTGRNYLDGESCFELHRWQDGTFVLRWRSPNLIENESSLLVLPLTRLEGPAVVAITRSRYHIFRYMDGEYTRETEGPMPFTAEEGAVGDLDGDGRGEIILSTTIRNTKAGREKHLRVLSWRDGKLIAVAASPVIGNVRALAAGDLDRDGRAEIVAEVGATTKTGEFHCLRLADGTLARWAVYKTGLPSITYGLSVGRQHPEPGFFVFAASLSGRLVTLAFGPDGLEPAGTNLVVQGFPVSLAHGDIDGDGRDDVILACDPHHLQVFGPAVPNILLRVDGASYRPAEPLRLWDGAVYAEGRSLAGVLGGEWMEATDASVLRFKDCQGRLHDLSVDPGALTACLDGQPLDLQPHSRRRWGYLYLPLEPVVRAAGYEYAWDASGGSVSVKRGASL